MREIKFRAYSKKEKNMYEVFSFCKDFIKIIAEGVGDGVLKFPIEDFEIMQFTGLKDENGKEIYEGDVVKFWGGIGRIAYSEDRCSFVIKYTDHDIFALHTSDEVIGNIYENPELRNKVNQ